MRLITSHELANRSKGELAALFYFVSKKLTITKAGTPERCNALGSLENIARARRAKMMAPRP